MYNIYNICTHYDGGIKFPIHKKCISRIITILVYRWIIMGTAGLNFI